MQRFGHFHVQQPPGVAVPSEFYQVRPRGNVRVCAERWPPDQRLDLRCVTGRSSRWVPRPNPYATVVFGFQFLDPEAADPIFIAVWSHFSRLVLAALFAVVRAHWSICSALLASIRVCLQRSRPDLRPSASTLDRMVGTSGRRRRGRDRTDANKREQPRTGARGRGFSRPPQSARPRPARPALAAAVDVLELNNVRPTIAGQRRPRMCRWDSLVLIWPSSCQVRSTEVPAGAGLVVGLGGGGLRAVRDARSD